MAKQKNKTGIMILCLLVLIISACSINQQKNTVSEKTNNVSQDVISCNDYNVQLPDGSMLSLTDIIRQDHKDIIKTEQLSGDVNRNRIENVSDIQLGYHSGKLSGYITFLDGQDSLTVGNIGMQLKIYQLNDSLEADEEHLLYSKSVDVTEGDFKNIYVDDDSVSQPFPAYVIGDIDPADFNFKPTGCLGQAEVFLPGTEGEPKEFDALILLYD
jgi:hypothetical protein